MLHKKFYHRISKFVSRVKNHKFFYILKSFGLIQLLVVMAIILLISIYAVSAYKDYVVRSQVVEALELLKDMQIKVAQYYEINGTMPSSAQFPSVNNPSKLVSQLMVENNGGINGIYVVKIHATFSTEADQNLVGKSIFIEGKVKNNTWIWLCRHSVGILVIDNKYLPETCQFEGACPDLFCLDEQI